MAIKRTDNLRLAVAILPCAIAVVSCGARDASDEHRRQSITAAYIDAIREESSLERKVALGERLTERLRRNPELATDKDIQALAKLMYDREDLVRDQTAKALAELGDRAQPASPALIFAFKKSVCMRVDASSASSIAYALTKMNVPVPYSQCQPWLQTMFANKGMNRPGFAGGSKS